MSFGQNKSSMRVVEEEQLWLKFSLRQWLKKEVQTQINRLRNHFGFLQKTWFLNKLEIFVQSWKGVFGLWLIRKNLVKKSIFKKIFLKFMIFVLKKGIGMRKKTCRCYWFVLWNNRINKLSLFIRLVNKFVAFWGFAILRLSF